MLVCVRTTKKFKYCSTQSVEIKLKKRKMTEKECNKNNLAILTLTKLTRMKQLLCDKFLRPGRQSNFQDKHATQKSKACFILLRIYADQALSSSSLLHSIQNQFIEIRKNRKKPEESCLKSLVNNEGVYGTLLLRIE